MSRFLDCYISGNLEKWKSENSELLDFWTSRILGAILKDLKDMRGRAQSVQMPLCFVSDSQ